jgi:NADH-quinone oxidoreductase subunit L
MTYLPWIALLTPLASAVLILLVTRRSGGVSAFISVAAVLISLAASAGLLLAAPEPSTAYQWMNVPGGVGFSISFVLDHLSKGMLFVVTAVGALVHIYSLAYMREDEGRARYFAGLSLFMFSMIGIVLSDNFVMMFVFWELVGVSSYLLIGHWFFRDAPAAAANKAFIVNRLGDFGFMLGILMIWAATGTVVFDGIQANIGALTANPAYLTTAALLIFCGTLGKSAQFPLHVWLPDAMEGPTPVSALIHAATMVAAGVYMLVRVFFLVEATVDVQTVIAWIGMITALLAALIATQQNDIKRILAYSTLSQLGYMVLAVGVAAPGAAMFHLFTHAFFKALLFLGAGAVIHSMHHEQDIWKMGGLKNHMPWTFLTFLAGTLALTGCPFLSGFWSKDAILLAAQHRSPVFFGLGLATAFLTAFYMFRLFVVVFLGKPRSDGARRAHEAPALMTLPLWLLALPTVLAGYPFFASPFVELPHGEAHGMLVPALATGVFVGGAAVAWVLYSGKSSDPVLIPLFARKFYFDEAYAVLVRWTHDALAVISAWFDRWIIDGVGVRGGAGMTWGVGYVMRFLQFGNLQGYALLFGAGVIVLMYLILS